MVLLYNNVLTFIYKAFSFFHTQFAFLSFVWFALNNEIFGIYYNLYNILFINRI